MKKALSFIVSSLAFFTIAASGASANMIVNGSFENPAMSGYNTNTTVQGWTLESGSGIEIQNNAAGAPQDGYNLVELDSDQNSSMFQTIATTAGSKYDLSFWYSPRPDNAPESNTIEVYFNGKLLESMTGFSAGSTSWKEHTYLVTAIADTSILKFAAAGNNDTLGGYIDNVSMVPTPTPIPAAIWLFGSGIAGIAAARRRKKTA